MKTILNKPLSRRNFFQTASLGLLGASVGLSTQRAVAQEMSPNLPSALQRITVGDTNVTLIQENIFDLPLAAFGGGSEEGDVEALMTAYNLPTTGVKASLNLAVLRHGSDVILLDTGTGQNTVAALNGAGINPEEITRVVISHWHGDHVGGASTEGVVNFPNASYHFPEVDWEFISSADNDGARGALAALQPAEATGQLELYSAGELLPGLEAIAAPGHTPGHHAFLISSADDALMYTADTANHHVTALMRPEWAFGFDADPAQATATRRAVLERLATDGTRMLAYHFAFPGTGFISTVEGGYRFTPSG